MKSIFCVIVGLTVILVGVTVVLFATGAPAWMFAIVTAAFNAVTLVTMECRATIKNIKEEGKKSKM